MKNIKKLLFAVILLVAITHRHEDYCSDHPHGATGKQGSPYTFGPWMSKDNSKEKISHTMSNRDSIDISDID